MHLRSCNLPINDQPNEKASSGRGKTVAGMDRAEQQLTEGEGIRAENQKLYNDTREKLDLICRQKADKKALLNKPRRLRELVVTRPSSFNNCCCSSSYSWCRSRVGSNGREGILRQIEMCIRDCWGGKEEAYCACKDPRAWPAMDPVSYHCTCQDFNHSNNSQINEMDILNCVSQPAVTVANKNDSQSIEGPVPKKIKTEKET